MNPFEKLSQRFKAPRLTRPRIVLALVVAAGADGLQLLLLQFGWVGPDQVIDFVAMIIISGLMGFHILLLPTFVIELIPVLDDLPTWIACTAAVIALRKRDQLAHPSTPSPPEKPAIDV
jgi:hypothetical protein